MCGAKACLARFGWLLQWDDGFFNVAAQPEQCEMRRGMDVLPEAA